MQETAVARHQLAVSYALATDVLFAAGGVIAAVGLVWGIIALTSGSGSAPVRAALGPGGASIEGTY